MVRAAPAKISLFLMVCSPVLAIMGCTVIHPDDVVGLDDDMRRWLPKSHPSSVPLAVSWSGKSRGRSAWGYGLNTCTGHLKQLPDGTRCWFGEKQIVLEIRHKHPKSVSFGWRPHKLLLRLSDGNREDFKILVNGEIRRAIKSGEWYSIMPFVAYVPESSHPPYFSVISTVSIQSEHGVCLIAVILLDDFIVIPKTVTDRFRLSSNE